MTSPAQAQDMEVDSGGAQKMRSDSKHKHRRNRLANAAPYTKRQPEKSLGEAAGKASSIEEQQQLLLAEKQRVEQLPKGVWSRHRLKVLAQALQLIEAKRNGERAEELDLLLKQLKL
mmetsp:Transcript_62149/g.146530  ORF Transcript_62149/g.146530 Transcript_62149/m.146530 type:complete len:117 (-) Transcript_62149:6-356(-)